MGVWGFRGVYVFRLRDFILALTLLRFTYLLYNATYAVPLLYVARNIISADGAVLWNHTFNIILRSIIQYCRRMVRLFSKTYLFIVFSLLVAAAVAAVACAGEAHVLRP